jgi:threonine dehydratase
VSVTPKDIREAAERIAPFVARTPLLSCPRLDEKAGGQVLLKAECLQITGSFKLRGASNAILSLPEGTPGVVAYSSGNHAQAVALAAKRAGLPAVIVMPKDAPETKKRRTEDYGAELVLYDRQTESREEIGRALAEERGLALVPPYDHPHTMAGQGTAGLEIAEDLKARGLEPDRVLICCSGGGLAAGIGLAVKDVFPAAQIVTVEPSGFDDMARSLQAGERVTNPAAGGSICDALLVPTPGEITFPLLQALGARGVAVSDEEALAAMRYAAEELRVVLEPGGAVALAAILTGRVPTDGVTVAVLSGGNADAAMLSRALTV